MKWHFRQAELRYDLLTKLNVIDKVNETRRIPLSRSALWVNHNGSSYI